MARKISLSQFKSKIRQIENKQKQAINDYNRKVRQRNQKVKQAISKYNQGVRAYNSRVRSNRQRLRTELNRLSQHSTTTHYVVYQRSVISLSQSYNYLDQRSETGSLDNRYNRFLDLSENEAANSVEVLNSLLKPDDSYSPDHINSTVIKDELRNISKDLDNRWRGAIFSLNPGNPDAARHFCTSAREVITQILEIKAPDNEVIESASNCYLTDQGKPTRRSKIKFLLHRKGLHDDGFENFVEGDMTNIIELFRVFNDGTHGSSETFSLNQLSSIKKRVEDGVLFLSALVN